MAIAENDIIELVASGTYLGQLVENRYHIRLVSYTSANDEITMLTELMQTFESDILDVIAGVQSDEMQWDSISARNLNSTTAKQQILIATAGALAGTPLPSLIAYSFQLLLPDDVIRFGRKSIAAINSGSIVGNDPNAGALTALTAIGNALAAIMTTSAGDEWDVVVARVLSGAVRPFVPQSLRVAEALFTGIGTQYSRKKGNGA